MRARLGKQGIVAGLVLAVMLCAGCSDDGRNKAPDRHGSSKRSSLGSALDFTSGDGHRLNQAWKHAGKPYQPDMVLFHTCKDAMAVHATWTESCKRSLRSALDRGRVITIYASDEHLSLEISATRGSQDLSLWACGDTECRPVACGDKVQGKIVGRTPAALGSLPCRYSGPAKKAVYRFVESTT